MLSPYTLDRKKAERWLEARRGRDTDGVVAKRLDGSVHPWRTHDDQGEAPPNCRLRRWRLSVCEPKREVGSLLLGLYDNAGKFNHVGFTSTITANERPADEAARSIAGSPGFTGKAPGGPSRWSTERSGEWEPLRPELVVEVRYDHVTGDRFRHGTRLMRWRPDKSPSQCTFEQIAPLPSAYRRPTA